VAVRHEAADWLGSDSLHAKGDYLFSNHKREDIMRRNILAWAARVAASSMLLVSHANAGFEELGSLAKPTGAIFFPGTGTLDLVTMTKVL
jgi:hypothetical protein